MEKKSALSVKERMVRAASGILVAVMSLTLAGCGEQLARMEKNQLTLQAMMEGNAEQLASLAVRVEQNNQDLQGNIKHVQNNTQLVAADIAAVADAQMKLQGLVQRNDQNLAERAAMMEQNQQNLQIEVRDMRSETQSMAGQLTAFGDGQAAMQNTMQASIQKLIDKATRIEQNQQHLQAGIENVRSSIREATVQIAAVGKQQMNLQGVVKDYSQQMRDQITAIEQNQQHLQVAIENVCSSIQEATAQIAAVGKQQMNLQGVIKDYSQQMRNQITAVEQNQQRCQAAITDLRRDTENVTAGVSTVQENLLRLQEILDNRVRDMVSIIDVVGQEQLKFEEGIQKDIRAVAESVGLIEQGQAELQDQVQDVHSNIQAMDTNTLATLDDLKAKLSSTRPVEALEPKPSVVEIGQ